MMWLIRKEADIPMLAVSLKGRVTPASLKFNLIASRVKLMNYLIYFEGDIILYYDIYKENK